MRYAISNVAVELDEDDLSITKRIAALLDVPHEQFVSCTCVRRAIDARKRSHIHFVCSYEIETLEPLSAAAVENLQLRSIEDSALNPPCPEIFSHQIKQAARAIVIGAGPAGLFAALALAEAGVKVTLLERGKPVETRMRDIGRLRSRGELNPESNICFGEGGAGTYTDGKLYTRIKHPFLRWVLATFVRFGAGSDILVDAHPHLGTDKLVRIVRNMRHQLLELGVDYRFETRVDDLLLHGERISGVRLADGEEINAPHVILATGHSARDTFERLQALGIPMQAKAFAVGMRAEHPQKLIDHAQFGAMAGHPQLGAAEYSLTHQLNDAYLGKRGVYSFCMCPGGLIVPSPSESGHMVVNGMSNATRRGFFANSGIVAQITPEDIKRHGIHESPLMGIAFQRQLEAATYLAAGQSYSAPAMRLTDFVQKKATGTLPASSYKPGLMPYDLWQLFPRWVAEPLAEGIQGFGRRLRGYVSEDATLLASETRTSSPIRIPRAENMQSKAIAGLYPVGEGAGYAGGIVSAAVDGLKAAEAIIKSHA